MLVHFSETLETVFHFTANIYLITASNLKTIWKYINVLTSNVRYYNSHGLQVHDMFVFSLSHFLHNRLLKLCFSATPTNSGLFVQSGQAERWYKLTESFSCSASGWNTRTTPLEFLTSQYWLPLHCIVFCVYVCVFTTSLCFQLPHGDIVVITTSRELAPSQALAWTRLDYENVFLFFHKLGDNWPKKRGITAALWILQQE